MSDIHMSLEALLARWQTDPEMRENIVEWRTLPARAARLAPFPHDLHPVLVEALQSQRISALYTHQAQAWQHLREGKHIVVVTSTASGKTLCYNLPVLDALLRDETARALYLFPTKALTQDQLAGVEKLIEALGALRPPVGVPIAPAVYDGDTPASRRPAIRSQARLLLSNPDMLHTGILPHHTQWIEFFRHLRFVVLDELHTYRGVFGSHLANVLRRLKRIVRHYGGGAPLQFILTSATIANPRQLAEWLVEEAITVIDDDGSARGQRHLVLFNPPLVDKALGIRRGVLSEAARLADDLLAAQVQTIVFGQTRRGVEWMLKNIHENSAAASSFSPIRSSSEPRVEEPMGSSGRKVRAYRSGYLVSHRREIEEGLRDGTVRCVVATNALELGIDIGSMGAAVLAGYPGTIASSRQQMGRAGRGEAASLALLVASANPLDQYLVRHPEFFFDRSPEQALVAPDHVLILLGHLRCAAFELPFKADEPFGTVTPRRLREFLDFLKEQGELHQSGERYFWMSEKYPAQGVSLRNASPNNVALLCEGVTIGQVDTLSAAWMVHPGAVYLHEGQAYLVEALDLTAGSADLKPFDDDYTTDPRCETTFQLLRPLGRAEVCGGAKTYGEIAVTTQVVGFRRVKWGAGGILENLGFEPLDLPPSTLQTTGYWVTLSNETVEALQAEGLWNSAPNDYGPGWPKLAERVRARDGFRCQVCGAPEQGRAHHVHHKVPFRSFSSPEQANQLDNLITLCPPCHRRAELAVRVRSGLAGLGYVLGGLAPLFLMCDARDLGMNSDPHSVLAEGQPAVVLYDRVPAGIGFSARLFELHDDLVRRAREVIAACACSDGCPACVGPGGAEGYGSKKETMAILNALSASGSS